MVQEKDSDEKLNRFHAFLFFLLFSLSQLTDESERENISSTRTLVTVELDFFYPSIQLETMVFHYVRDSRK